MSEFKGTKGKWIVNGKPFYDRKNKTYSGAFDILSKESKVCEINAYNFWGLTFKESEANAKLISKAPEMLLMLEDIKDYLGSDKRKQVEQLIKEATKI